MGSSMAYGDNSCPQCGRRCYWTTLGTSMFKGTVLGI